jgi:hypothetical protein
MVNIITPSVWNFEDIDDIANVDHRGWCFGNRDLGLVGILGKWNSDKIWAPGFLGG